jgi:hypothetical protein
MIAAPAKTPVPERNGLLSILQLAACAFAETFFRADRPLMQASIEERY